MNHTRHMGLFNVPTYFAVGLVGAGGLGAVTALNLAKMGVRQLTIWDGDTVSDENLATQLHKVSDVGKLKTEALLETLELFSDEVLVDPIADRLGLGVELLPFDLFISAVDSITARQDIWNVVTNSRVNWYIDARMSAEQFQAFVVDMHDLAAVERYHMQLMSLKEEDVPDVPCTEKATFYCGSIAAGHIGAILRNILRNTQDSCRIVHYIPQFTLDKFKL